MEANQTTDRDVRRDQALLDMMIARLIAARDRKEYETRSFDQIVLMEKSASKRIVF